MNQGIAGKKPGKGTETAERPEPPPVHRPVGDQKRVNVDFPLWMVETLDREEDRLGVTRQSLIKFWIAERLDSLPSS